MSGKLDVIVADANYHILTCPQAVLATHHSSLIGNLPQKGRHLVVLLQCPLHLPVISHKSKCATE